MEMIPAGNVSEEGTICQESECLGSWTVGYLRLVERVSESVVHKEIYVNPLSSVITLYYCPLSFYSME
jgi:hypothetical protein